MKRILITAILLVVSLQSAGAQQPTFLDPLVDKMTGDWIMTGTISGKQVTHDVHAEWVLNHQYVRIHEVSRERNDKGQPAYEAEVYVAWNQQAKQYTCVWLDVYGGATTESLGYAKPDGDTIAFVIKGDDIFHTTFIYDATTNSWEWRMDSEKKDGTLKPFARLKLTK